MFKLYLTQTSIYFQRKKKVILMRKFHLYSSTSQYFHDHIAWRPPGKSVTKETNKKKHTLISLPKLKPNPWENVLSQPDTALLYLSKVFRQGRQLRECSRIWIQQLKSWSLNFNTVVTTAGDRVRK